mgnify:CR=1 FL=1
MEMGKIALACGSLSRGGAERITLYLAQFFQENGRDVVIVTGGIGKNEYPIPKGIKRISLNTDKHTNAVKSLISGASSFRKIIREEELDLVIILGISVCSYIIPGCIGTKIKIIVSERNDPTHYAGRNITKNLSRFLMRFADGYVFQTKEVKKFYHKICRGRGKVIFNPLLTKNLPNAYLEKKEKIIVSVGRLDPQKNQKLLITAFSKIAKRHPEYKLIIYGEGKLRTELERLVSALDLKERIELPGNKLDVLEYIKSSQIFVLSSDFEGMPNALIEAMAMGLACISTDCPSGGPRALIENGKNGVLVQTGNSKEMAEAIEVLLDDKDYRDQISIAATDIRKMLDVNKIGKEWMDYVDLILGGEKN